MKAPFPVSGAIRWACAMNAWKPGFMGFARPEEHERGFKATAACGFQAVELKAGSGRWDPLGRPDGLTGLYGSVAAFRSRLADWGIDRVSSIYYDPFQMSFEDLHFGLDPLNEAQLEVLVRSAAMHAACLAELGGERLVVRPVGSYWKVGALTDAQLTVLARTWGAVGTATRVYGVGLALHVDALSALRTVGELQGLLSRLDPELAGLALDTAELAIQGHDVAALYEALHERVVHCHFKDALAIDELDEYRTTNAERALLQAGGARRVARWFSEMGTPAGKVDFERLLRAMVAHGYRGWVVAESDGGPAPVAAGIMSNGWYIRHRLLPLVAPGL